MLMGRQKQAEMLRGCRWDRLLALMSRESQLAEQLEHSLLGHLWDRWLAEVLTESQLAEQLE
jgi:hypothetical protein